MRPLHNRIVGSLSSAGTLTGIMIVSLDSLGFSLYPVKTRDGSAVFRLETAFKLAAAFPLDIFIEETSTGFHVFDEGMTFHNLLSLGVRLQTPEQLNSLRTVIGQYAPITFTEQGTIEVYGSVDHAANLVALFISSTMGINQWLSSALGKTHLVEERPSGSKGTAS